MGRVVSLNGELMAAEEAKVSILDRGFLYGDSVYEVLRTYDGVPFELDRHLQRLKNSALRIGMGLPVPLSTFAEDIRKTHDYSQNAESYLRIVSTRGEGQLGLDPSLAEHPSRLVLALPVNPPPPETYENGVKVSLVSVRRNLSEAIDPLAKTGNYLNSVMALAEARKSGAHEAIMLDHRDHVTEGASSNVFAVIQGVILTPPLEAGILQGITRTVVMEVAELLKKRVLELPLTEATLRQADEVFITSSIREIVPVVRIDDDQVGQGVPGPVVTEIRAGFREYVKNYVKKHQD